MIIPIISGTKRSFRPTGNIWTIDGDENKLNILSVASYGLYAPTCLFSNGRTYLSTRKSHVNDLGRAGIVQYYNNNVSIEFMSVDPTYLNYHDNVTLMIANDENIYLLHEQHNQSVNELWETGTPHDITTFTQQTDTPDIGDYPKMFKKSDGTWFSIGREWPPSTNRGLDINTFNGSSWGGNVKLMDPGPDPAGTVLTYPFYITNAENIDGKFYFNFKKRVGFNPEDIIAKYNWMAYCHENDIYRWFNVQGTFSKKVDTQGHLTETELNNNYRYAVNTVESGGIGGSSLLHNNIILKLDYVDGNWIMYKFENGLWTSGISDISKVRFLLTDKLCIGMENNIISIYESVDSINWNLKQELFEDSIGIANQIVAPYNLTEIPNGSKFAIFAASLKNGNTDQVNGSENNNIYVIEMIK